MHQARPPGTADAPVVGPEGMGGGLAHRPSHRDLLRRRGRVHASWLRAVVDAIVIPASRPVGNLADAARLSVASGSPLVVLCSRQARASEVARWFADMFPASIMLAVDVVEDSAAEWTRLPIADHPEAGRDGYADVATKRNIALLVARMTGWREILFLDDDMRGLDPRALRRAAAVLRSRRRADVIAWVAEEFADNSVVCHAHRRCGGEQDVFPGAGSLAVRTEGVDLPFFPPVYNEDWLFLVDFLADRRVICGGRVRQMPYDPFEDPRRAEWQEFGDTLGEGMFELLHRRADVGEASGPGHWHDVLAARRRLLDGIVHRLDGLPADERAAVRRSLDAARSRSAAITASSLAEFAGQWRRDLGTWRERLDRLPSVRSAEAALELLGLRVFAAGG